MGTAAASSVALLSETLCCSTPLVLMRTAGRDRVVVTEKEKMSKQHSPGSFVFFFFLS